MFFDSEIDDPMKVNPLQNMPNDSNTTQFHFLIVHHLMNFSSFSQDCLFDFSLCPKEPREPYEP